MKLVEISNTLGDMTWICGNVEPGMWKTNPKRIK
jgi:hypothetical protein